MGCRALVNLKVVTMNARAHFFLLFFILFSQVSYASEIQINPDTVTLFQNVSIQINVTGNPGDAWKLVIVKPDGTNETIDSGILDASGNYISSYLYNTTLLGIHYADLFLNDAVNVTNAWITYGNASRSIDVVVVSFSLSFSPSNSTKNQSSLTPAFILSFYSTSTAQNQTSQMPAFSLEFLPVNTTQNQTMEVPAFSLEFRPVNTTQHQHGFSILRIAGYLQVNLYINSTFVAPQDVLKIWGNAIVYFDNGTVANASNAETHVYVDGVEYFLDPSTGLIDPTGTQPLTTNTDGTFVFYLMVKAIEGVHNVNVTVIYANYSGSNSTYFIIPKITIKLAPAGYFTSYDNSTSWAYGSEDVLYGLAKEGYRPSETSSDMRGIELNFSYVDRVYMVFSRNDPETFKKRARMAKTAELFEYPRPSFAYTLGRTYILRVILEYDDISINGREQLWKGIHNLLIQHSPKSNNEVIVKRI